MTFYLEYFDWLVCFISKKKRFYDESEFEMTPVHGPERGRRSQRNSARSKP